MCLVDNLIAGELVSQIPVRMPLYMENSLLVAPPRSLLSYGASPDSSAAERIELKVAHVFCTATAVQPFHACHAQERTLVNQWER